MKEEITHDDGSDGGVNGSALANLYLVHLLLENGTTGIGSGYDIDFDDGLRILSAVVGRLDGNTVLLASIEFTHRLDQATLRLNLELLQAVVRHVVDAVGDLCVWPNVVVRRFDLTTTLIIFISYT